MKGLKELFVFVAIVVLCSGCVMQTTSTRHDVPVVDGVIHVTGEGETLPAIAEAYGISSQLLRRSRIQTTSVPGREYSSQAQPDLKPLFGNRRKVSSLKNRTDSIIRSTPVRT